MSVAVSPIAVPRPAHVILHRCFICWDRGIEQHGLCPHREPALLVWHLRNIEGERQ